MTTEATPPEAWSEDQFDVALRQARAERVIDARNVTLSGDRLERLLRATTEGEPTGPEVRTALFAGTRFLGHAHFANTVFRGEVDFTSAVFTSSVSFHQASFGEHAPQFDRIHVEGWAFFTELNFDPTPGWLRNRQPPEQRIASGLSFVDAKFASTVRFDDTVLPPWVSFRDCEFAGVASWDRCGFRGNVWFDLCRFLGPVRMFHLAAVQDVSFVEARFEEARAIGPIFAGGKVDFQRTYFARPVSLGAMCRMLWLNNAIFGAGVDAFVEAADMSVEEVDFGGSSLVARRSEGPRVMRQARMPATNRWEDAEAGAFFDDVTPTLGAVARVVSTRRAKVADLTFSGVDAEPCRFSGAHGLSSLKLDSVRFGRTPQGWRGLRWPPRWTDRRVIAEEQHWRARQRSADSWYPLTARPPEWLGDDDEPIAAGQIEVIYRALRGAIEASKDESGAADFYYGEMEMRRNRLRASLAERTSLSNIGEAVLLALYWAVSGYGLRASRALTCLGVTIIIGAAVLSQWGFVGRAPAGGPLAFALESTISLLRAPAAKLTATGEYVQIALRLLGPLFLGLALLALRGASSAESSRAWP